MQGHFSFKEFNVRHEKSAFKVGTDGCLLGAWAEVAGDLHVLDVGTGSGVLALMLAQRSQAHIDAIEQDAESAREAIQNMANSKWRNRLNCFHTTLQNYVKSSVNRNYDHVVCNPPFFSSSTLSGRERKDQARHDTMLRLPDLLEGSFALTNARGKLSLVLPEHRVAELMHAAQTMAWHCIRLTKIRPVANKAIHRSLITFSKCSSSTQEAELTLYDSHQVYSPEAISLLKPYYLHL